MSKLADALLTTTQQRVLGLLYAHPDKSFYMKEIIRSSGMGVATIKRELDRMLDAGIVTMAKVGNQHHYQANPDCPVYAELRGIVSKTLATDVSVEPELAKGIVSIGAGIDVSRQALAKLAKRFHIVNIYLFGSAARNELGPDSDIDLLIDFASGESPSLGGMVAIREAFSMLFGGRSVDVATRAILENPYRRKQIEKDIKELYAA